MALDTPYLSYATKTLAAPRCFTQGMDSRCQAYCKNVSYGLRGENVLKHESPTSLNVGACIISENYSEVVCSPYCEDTFLVLYVCQT